jgi:hypothetical protein
MEIMMTKHTVATLVASAAVVLSGLGVGWAIGKSPPLPAGGPVSTGGYSTLTGPASDTNVVPQSFNLQPGGGVPVSGGASASTRATHQTANFVVTASSPWMARAVANEAEFQRATLAKQWLGKALPEWREPCPVKVTLAPEPGGGGTTTFTFAPAGKNRLPGVSSQSMELRGSFEQVLATFLPHEVAHTVLATHFGRPLPRWADEGAALSAEPAAEQAKLDARAHEILGTGRAVRLKSLFRMTEYPRDVATFFAQGHSVVRFLLSRKGTIDHSVFDDLPGGLDRFFTGIATPAQRFIVFLQFGSNGNTAEAWDKAARRVYGFDSVEKLEEAWIEWLNMSDRGDESKSEKKAAQVKPETPEEKVKLLKFTKTPEEKVKQPKFTPEVSKPEAPQDKVKQGTDAKQAAPKKVVEDFLTAVRAGKIDDALGFGVPGWTYGDPMGVMDLNEGLFPGQPDKKAIRVRIAWSDGSRALAVTEKVGVLVEGLPCEIWEANMVFILARSKGRWLIAEADVKDLITEFKKDNDKAKRVYP